MKLLGILLTLFAIWLWTVHPPAASAVTFLILAELLRSNRTA